MRTLKILALLTDGFGAPGGIARYNRDLMTAFAKAGHDVRIVPRFGSKVEPTPPGVTQIEASSARNGWIASCVMNAVRGHHDVIFCGHINAIPLAAGIARLLRQPLWLQVHGFEAWTARSAAVQSAVERSQLVTSVSRYTRSRLLQWTRIEPARVRVLPNTFSCDFAPRERRADLIERYGLTDRKVIVTVGRIEATEKYKGHDKVIRLMPRVLNAEPRAHYLVVGSGSDKERLKALAITAGIGDRVTFAGQVPPSELADHFALGDVFAMPSTGEGFGIVFLEAAAAGLSVVGGNRDGSIDALADGRIGRAVDPDNDDELLAALVHGLRKKWIADTEALAQFSFDHFAAHANGLLDELIADHARSRTGRAA